MPKALQGSDLLLFFRKYANRDTDSAARLYFQTEHSIEKTKESETTTTKDGQINTTTDGDNTVPMTSVAYVNDDSTQEMWEELEEWYDNNELVEVWELNRRKVNEEGQYRARYFQGRFTDFTISAPSDGVVTLDMTYAIDGSGTKGYVTADSAQQQVAAYAFTDLDPVAPEV